MFKNFWNSQEQQAQSRPHQISTDSWCPPSVVSSSSSSLPGTPGGFSSGVNMARPTENMARPTDRPNSSSNVSPAEAAGIIAILKDKSVDELRKLLSDKESYQNLLLSLEPVKTQNRVRDELRNETLQLARDNLEKEPLMVELRNQCRIIRTTELAAAQEKLNELERKKENALKYYSPSSLVHRIQDTMNKTEEESEALHKQVLDRELDITAFVQKYKKTRLTYHKQALTHLAMQTPLPSRA